ncbi:5'-nucleotidase, lipoprotein e(P4) family [Bacillus salipaludis]|uniref:5'-nucleotidase, lipoprotein e(P4) family n=1 Tax=Bacillus salipaludis TaxID=2547811 RepID=UPI002E218C0C|nr:5'-nucleotidase, lipoprotein e(P4) family [Bacillus salipaludis]
MNKYFPFMAMNAFVISILLSACSASHSSTTLKESEKKQPKTESVESRDSNRRVYENNINSILWFQKSGEARALYYQAFNTADIMLEKVLTDKTFEKKPAVIVDLDETILDNSAYMAALALNGIEDWSYWDEWSEAMKAKATPGSVEFLNKVVKKGVDVFYVSNRYLENVKSTKQNLIDLGFPQTEESHMLFVDRNASSSKESRREEISKTHDIVLLMGDRLGDFSDIFEVSDDEKRNEAVDGLKDKFGKSFIVLPNPMYGYWVNHLTDNYDKMTTYQKRTARIKELEVWKTNLIK